ncbi:hypothetical protein RvY_16571 [Ramazzottius varieornatus]|uniref:Alpha-N-acetylglucosaminidase N-terminal domain-containing protein n=1 Tax=Ramazzottius varieornatus TaxID=947166 RepID=A0A1D1W6F2_RAMVA|nr:hypothetical protein RvY_16571 [Ramazzottius varieornatus]
MKYYSYETASCLFLVCFTLVSYTIAHDVSLTFPDLRNTILKTKSKADPDIQHAAVEDLIRRLFDPMDASRFLVEVQPEGLGDPAFDAARVTSFGGNVVRIVGNSGTACAFALYHFMKYHCDCQVAWSGRQLHLPEKFPVVSQLVKKADWCEV